MDSTDRDSTWINDVKEAQHIINANVAQMLANKMTKSETEFNVLGTDKKRKSFLVEFSSETEYEHFLEFKNRLTASSCSSPSGDECLTQDMSISPLSRVPHDYEFKRDYNGATITSVPESENEISDHLTTSTTPSISSSESSSYLATLIEEDEEEVGEYEDENTIADEGRPPLDVRRQGKDEQPLHAESTTYDNSINGNTGESGRTDCARSSMPTLKASLGACPNDNRTELKQMQIPVHSKNVKQTESTSKDFSTELVAEGCVCFNCFNQEPESTHDAKHVHLKKLDRDTSSASDCTTGISVSIVEPPIETWLRGRNESRNRVPCRSTNSDLDVRGECSNLTSACESEIVSQSHCEEGTFQGSAKSVCDCDLPSNRSLCCELPSSCAVADATPSSELGIQSENESFQLHNDKSCSCLLKSSGISRNNNNNINNNIQNNNINAKNHSEVCSEGIRINNNDDDDDDSYDTNVTFFSCCSSPPLEANSKGVENGPATPCDKSDTDNLNQSVQRDISADSKVGDKRTRIEANISSNGRSSSQEGLHEDFLVLRSSSSTSSLNSSFSENSASFSASNRLKRLEERLKKFHFTKKLVSEPDDASYDRDEPNVIEKDSDNCDRVQGEPTPLLNFGDNLEVFSGRKRKSASEGLGENLFESYYGHHGNNQYYNLTVEDVVYQDQTYGYEKSAELVLEDRNNNNKRRFVNSSDEAVTRFSSPSPTNLEAETSDKTFSKCTFDAGALDNYPNCSSSLQECYDELALEELDVFLPQLNCLEDDCCDCDPGIYPSNLQHLTHFWGKMRDAAAAPPVALRGLLKKPNRPPQQRKNRVVFDETRNEFFDADYIILIREDCPYDEEDEEPCTCGEHELVRLCCEEGCQCQFEGDSKTPQSPKFAPPIEFVDQATLSPPEGYKDAAALALGGALGGHVFGAQHIQQLQVIQRLQQQRAAMLAARNSQQPNNGVAATPHPSQSATTTLPTNASSSSQSPYNQVCTECAECAECAAKQDEDCQSACPDELGGRMGVPHVAIVPIKAPISSQKEIIAGEERPKYFTANKIDNNNHDPEDYRPPLPSKIKKEPKVRGMPHQLVPTIVPSQRIIVETITTTMVTERRILGGITDNRINITATHANNPASSTAPVTSEEEEAPALPPKENQNRTLQTAEQPPDSSSLAGILKGGKLWKSETGEDSNNITSDEETNNGTKRSVRFSEKVEQPSQPERDDNCDGNESEAQQTDDGADVVPMEILPMKKHTSLFHNALRPNSAVRQLFPAGPTLLTQDSLRSFEESKRPSVTTASQPSTSVASESDTDTIRKTIERNALRRSLIKYEPKKVTKQQPKSETSLEERIRLLTCDIDEPVAGGKGDVNKDELERRNSPTGEENPQQPKYISDKNYSPPSSSTSSTSSGSASAYRKITDIFNKNQRQDKIPEGDEGQTGILPQDCRCPSAPDLGIGVQMPQTHTQVHHTPPRQGERRQFLSTLAPLTACVAGQRDDMSYYTLSSAPGDRQSTASSHCSEYSLGDIESVLRDDDTKKVAPDVIAGTPGQESDELAAFAQQEASRTDRIKKRYSGEPTQVVANKTGVISQGVASGAASDEDDEHNDYGFNKRPSVRGIKPRFGTTNEILQQMQAQLAQPGPLKMQSSSAASPGTPQIIQKVQTVVQQQQIATAAAPGAAQHPGQWGYYALGEQQAQLPLQRPQSTNGVPEGDFYGQLPTHMRHSFHGHHDAQSTLCQGVIANSHPHQPQHPNAPYGHFMRSPTRRPESPPPLRNYHQMVLIPYNTETYAHYSANEHVPGHQIRRLEYQQVTQQTIRVPMGFPLPPGMQMQLVAAAGRGGATTTTTTTTTNEMHSNYATLTRLRPVNGNFEFVERGAPEGAAATNIHPLDHKTTPALQQPPSAAGAIVPIQTGPPVPATANAPSNVFYAMNV